MIAFIFNWLLGGGIAALGKEIRQARIDKAKADTAADRIAADVRIAELTAERSERLQKLSDPLLKLPLFLAELTVAVYIAAIMVDSTFPMEWLTPLELPNWFKPQFAIVVASIFGISAVDRWRR